MFTPSFLVVFHSGTELLSLSHIKSGCHRLRGCHPFGQLISPWQGVFWAVFVLQGAQFVCAKSAGVMVMVLFSLGVTAAEQSWSLAPFVPVELEGPLASAFIERDWTAQPRGTWIPQVEDQGSHLKYPRGLIHPVRQGLARRTESCPRDSWSLQAPRG